VPEVGQAFGTTGAPEPWQVDGAGTLSKYEGDGRRYHDDQRDHEDSLPAEPARLGDVDLLAVLDNFDQDGFGDGTVVDERADSGDDVR
jgi:hypothetical protein